MLASIDIGTPLGRRDRCIIETFAYTGARVGAVAALRMEDFQKREGGWEVRFSEKGGQQRSIPVRYDLALSLHDYLEAAGIAGAEARSPFWRAARDRGGAVLTNHGISPYAIRAMLKRRLRSAGLPMGISPHSFRVFVVTDLLNQGVPVEEVQYLVGHASARTTAIYDRRQRRVSRNIVERISI